VPLAASPRAEEAQYAGRHSAVGREGELTADGVLLAPLDREREAGRGAAGR
jgi:hypothetical protein